MRMFLRLIVLASLLAVLTLSLIPAISVFAEGEEIQVLSEEVESRFPTGVAFKVTASSPNIIKEIRVFFKAQGRENSSYAVIDFEPGTQVSAEHLLSITSANHIPPGSSILYSFEIRDGEGQVLRTQEKQAIYEDSRFEWKEINEGFITVYYYGPVERRAQTVMDSVQETIDRMGPVLGLAPQIPIRVVAYNNYRHMASALPFRSQAIREELQTQGMAFVNQRVLLVLAFDTGIRGLVSHEFAHQLIADAAGGAYPALPAWLNEGLAEYANLEPGIAYDRALAYGVFTRRLKPLWYLREFIGEPDDVIIAYGHSSSVVHYLINTYGEEKIPLLMRALRETVDIDLALKQVYGFDQYGLDSEWRLRLGLEPFPRPEELARQLEVTPSPTPKPRAQSAPSPTPSPTPTSEGATRTTSSCSRSSAQEGASLPWDLSLLALFGAPLALVAVTRDKPGKDK